MKTSATLRLAASAVTGLMLVGAVPALSPASSQASAAAKTYTVRPGDSLWLIAQRTRTTVDGLHRANGLPGTLIRPGQVLRLPGAGAKPKPKTTRAAKPKRKSQPKPKATSSAKHKLQAKSKPTRPKTTSRRHYVVRPGDSLWLISRRHNVGLNALVSANRINPSAVIRPGDRLAIPRVGARAPAAKVAHTKTAQTTATRSKAAQRKAAQRKAAQRKAARKGPAKKAAQRPKGRTSPAALPRPARAGAGLTLATAVQRNRATSARLPQPKPAKTRATVVRVAKRHGVDPVLALGVAYTESRLRQGAVSYANAIGTMQVLPSTGDWIAGKMAGRPLNLFKVEDNATAGVLYLRYLLERLPRDHAIAAYFQGQGSVKRNGITAASRGYLYKVHAHMKLFR